ncbi:MAG: hypothetical protein GY796_26375 [Chloroflexi bacterium]|nr:hypothetical protein [Chloroflexota bacterium]
MSRKYFVIAMLIIAISFTQIPQLQAGQSQRADTAVNLTLPTRTSTPAPAEPTAAPTNPPSNPQPTNPPSNPQPTNPPSNPQPTNPPANPQPTNTSVPTSVPTAIPTAVPATPVGGILPTAVPCSSQPTIQVTNGSFANVRTGPGTDYEISGQLLHLEVRPIIGRAAEAPWWVIQMPNGESGWVADTVGLIQGDTSLVPIIELPLIGGATVTPAAPWQPTPPANCPTPEAEAAPTATTAANNNQPINNDNLPTAPASPEDVPTDSGAYVEGATSGENVAKTGVTGENGEGYPTPVAEELETNVKSVTAVTPTPTAISLADSSPADATAPEPIAADPTASNSTAPASTAPIVSGSDLLLAGAAVLLLAGIAAFVVMKRF